MLADNQPTDSYRFGPFLVDTPAGQLRKGATKIRLAGQPFEILLMLLERPGQVVSREEIQQQLWPRETFVDFENSLNKSINKLRQALSDSADQPIYIETLPRRGYRFVGSLLPVPPEEQPKPAPASQAVLLPNPPPIAARIAIKPARPFAVLRFAALSLLLPVAFLLWLGLRPLPAPRLVGVRTLTTSSRVDLYGGLHSDGVRLFFLIRNGHKWQLSQMPVAGGEVQPVALPFENVRLASVSPDGSQFAVEPFDARRPALPLWIISSVGGTPRKLGDIVANDAVFTHDGKKITYSTPDGGLSFVDLESGKISEILRLSGPKWGLAWSPDGSRLRFHWSNDASGHSHIWEIRADGSGLHQILPNWTAADGLCCGRWTTDGRYYLFLASLEKSPASVWALREPSGWFHREQSPIRLSTEPLPASVLLPSLDGKRIFLLGNNARSEYVRVNSATNEVHSLLGGQPAAWPTFNSQGDWVVFRGEANALWRSNLNGTSRLQIVSGKFDPGLPSIRPDGKMIAFRAQPPGAATSRIDVVSSDGGQPEEIASARLPLSAPAWTPDGSKVSYAVDDDADPSSGIYFYDFVSKATQKIPGSEGFWKHKWSPDGKYLAGVTVANDRIAIYNLASRKWKTVATGKVFSPVFWSSNSQFLFFQDLLESGEPVHRLRLADSSVTTVFECSLLLEGGVHRCGLEGLAPDGTLILQLNRGDHDVYALDVDLP